MNTIVFNTSSLNVKQLQQDLRLKRLDQNVNRWEIVIILLINYKVFCENKYLYFSDGDSLLFASVTSSGKYFIRVHNENTSFKYNRKNFK